MTVKIKVFSDYVCPYCFLAEFPLAAAIAQKDVEVEWLPFELRPEPTPTLKPEDDYLQTVWRRSVYPLASKMGVEIKLPSVSPQPYTHLAFEGYQYATAQGKANEYNDRVLRAFFQAEQDIGQIDVLTNLAESIGLNGAEFKAVLETRKYKAVHQQALEYARELDIHSVPTFMIGARILPGVLSQETIEQAMASPPLGDAAMDG